MRYRRSAFLFIIIYILFFCPSLFARENPFGHNIELTSARTAALGGFHAALADDISTLFGNPAGFRSAGPEFSIGGITLNFFGAAADVAGDIISGSSGATQYPYAGIYLQGPIELGYVGNGLGFGIFTTTNIRFWEPGTGTGVITSIEETFIFVGGYAFRIPLPENWNSTLDLGFSIRPFIASRSIGRKDMQDVYNFILNPLNPLNLINNTQFQLRTGVGFDLGILYAYKETFSIGLAGRNFSIAQMSDYDSFDAFIKSEAPRQWTFFYALELSLGILWRPQLGRLGRNISDLTLMLDYQDIFDFLIWPKTASNPLLHIGIGCELKLLEIISIRAGFFQLLPSAGLGIDLTIFSLNMAVFGRELSSEPWGWPIYNYLIALEFTY